MRINGTEVKTGYLVKPNDLITLNLPESVGGPPFPENIPLDILY